MSPISWRSPCRGSLSHIRPQCSRPWSVSDPLTSLGTYKREGVAFPRLFRTRMANSSAYGGQVGNKACDARMCRSPRATTLPAVMRTENPTCHSGQATQVCPHAPELPVAQPRETERSSLALPAFPSFSALMLVSTWKYFYTKVTTNNRWGQSHSFGTNP